MELDERENEIYRLRAKLEANQYSNSNEVQFPEEKTLKLYDTAIRALIKTPMDAYKVAKELYADQLLFTAKAERSAKDATMMRLYGEIFYDMLVATAIELHNAKYGEVP